MHNQTHELMRPQTWTPAPLAPSSIPSPSSQLDAATVAAELSARTSAFRFGPSSDPGELIALAPRADLPRIDVARPGASSAGAFAGRQSTALAHTRLFDIVCAAFALILLLPVLLFAAIAIRVSSPGPIFFVQHRVGRNGKSFPCLKFRSMVVDAQQRLDALLATSEEARREWALDQKLRSDPRITPIGQLLRKTSLDELPQLLNVLAGHMSIVGPRPIVENEIVRYGSRFTAYCAVRPGLTGLWQVSGRNEVSYETRVRLDAFYAARKSLAYDLTICFRTIPAVLLSRGCY